MQTIYEQVIPIFEKAGEKIRTALTHEIHYSSKSSFDYVSTIDLDIQDYLVQSLSSLDPSWQYLCEESTEIYSIENGWIIDPIDGTTNLLHGYPHFAISAAHVVNAIPQFAIIFNPLSMERYTAILHNGAFLNGHPIHVSTHTNLKDCILGVGFPYDRTHAPFIFNTMNRLYQSCQDIKRKGSASLDLAYVACGRLDGYFELDLKPWDIAAGMLLIQEAGGLVELCTTSNHMSLTIASNGLLQDTLKSSILSVS